MVRMLRKNFHRQPGCVERHGSECNSCKPDEYKGRARENEEWKREELDNDI